MLIKQPLGKLAHTLSTTATTLSPLKTISIDSTDGTRIPVSVIGEGSPVLMLHAFGMDARQFLPFILPMINQYQFYLPHFCGFGLADKQVLSQFDFIEQYAADTEQVIQHIVKNTGISKVPVAGISMGALVMWAYFKRFGTSRVSRYLNIDQAPIVHNTSDWQGGVFGAQQAELFAQFQQLIDNAAPYMQVDDFRQLPSRIKLNLLEVERNFSLLSISRKSSKLFIQASNYRAPRKIETMQHSTWQHKLRCLAAYVELPYDYRDVLPTVDVPTMLLIGGRSKLYDPKWQLKLADILPDAKVEIIANAGHAVPMDTPIAFHRVLKLFLQSE